jgi:hypothetical protein
MLPLTLVLCCQWGEIQIQEMTFKNLSTKWIPYLTHSGEIQCEPQLYEGESNENRKHFLKFNLLNESGTQLYHFST